MSERPEDAESLESPLESIEGFLSALALELDKVNAQINGPQATFLQAGRSCLNVFDAKKAKLNESDPQTLFILGRILQLRRELMIQMAHVKVGQDNLRVANYRSFFGELTSALIQARDFLEDEPTS